MIKHIVMWKLKVQAEGATKAENMVKMRAMIEALPAQIQDVQRLEIGLELEPAESKFDVVLYSEFDDWQALERYQKHPAHLKVAEFIAKINDQRAVVDYRG